MVVRSRTIVVSMPWGIEAFRDGSVARILSTVWMILAPGWRKMIIIDRGNAVQKPAGTDVRDRIGDVGNIRKPDRSSVVVANDNRFVIVGS